MNSVTMKNTTCGPQYCDGTPERGKKTYKNNWGPQPCPKRAPFNGFNCANIIGWYGDDISFENVYVEGGSKGISVQISPRASMKNVIAKNIRGPFPAGQCFQIANKSDESTLEDFYCLNE